MNPYDTLSPEGYAVSHPHNPVLQWNRRPYPVHTNAERQELRRRVQSYSANMGEHPGVPKIIDYDKTILDDKTKVDGRLWCWVAWEEVNGDSLDEEYCEKHEQMSLEELLDCQRQLAAILIVMHEHGVAHYDIRPSTIRRITQHNVSDEETPVQKPTYTLIGWYMAKPSSETYDMKAYPYFPPEIDNASLGQLGTAADVYALAVTLYMLYTGRSPFAKTETLPTQIRRQHREDPPVVDGVPKPLRPLFEQALRKNPAERPTMRAFQEEFERAYQQIITPQKRQKTRFTRRQAIIILATMLVPLLLFWLYSVLNWLLRLPWPRTSDPRKPANVGIGGTFPTFTAHDASVKAAEPSPDGRLTLSADSSGRLIVSAIPSRQLLLDDRFRHGEMPIISATWAPNSQAFATLDASGLAWLWHLQDGGQFVPFAQHRFAIPVGAIAWSPTQDRLMVASGSRVLVYDNVLNQGFVRLLATYPGHNDTVTCLAFSPDGKIALSGSEDRTVQLWEVETAQRIHRCEDHNSAAISAVAYSPDERFVASGSEDTTVQVMEAQGYIGSIQFAYRHDGAVNDVDFSHNGQYLASGGNDSIIYIYDLHGTLRHTYGGHGGSVTTVKWIALSGHLGPGEYLLSSSGTEIKVWQIP